MYLYNPKLADPAHLEKMLIGRRDMADWLERIAILFAETGKATHTLLIGNRGMGKSHLINALYHRLKHTEVVRKNVVVAFLDEDPYGIASYFDLLRHIVTVIAKRAQNPVDKQHLLDALKTLIGTKDEKQLTAATERILTAHLAGRRLLLLAENLNVIFEAIRDEGQGRWRDFLQTHDNTMICATAQAIFSEVQQRERPFFGFFHVTYLQKLRYEEARDLLIAMTEQGKQSELTAYIETLEGEAKLRAIFELTEGNHRLLVAFCEFFIAEFRSELSKSFLRTLDQLKPYYESFLKVLPPQQQKIVQFLASERIPQPGRAIADNCFLQINTLSKQMSELQRLGYVQNTRQGRDAYYEITEPMLRLCLEANENTDGILSIFVDFLGNLYPVRDLKFHTLQFLLFSETAPDAALRTKMAEEAHLYRKAAKRYACWEPDTQELLEAREAPAYEQEQTIRRMVEDSELQTHEDKFYDLVHTKQYRAAESLLEQIFPDHLSHYYWRLLGYLLWLEGNLLKAEEAFNKSTAIKPHDEISWYNFGVVLTNLNQLQQAEAAYKKVIEIRPDYANAWNNLGFIFINTNRIKEAENAYQKAIEIKPDFHESWCNLGSLLQDTSRTEEAESAYKKSIEINPSYHNAWYNLANLLEDTNHPEEAEAAYKKSIEIQPNDADTWHNLGILLTRVYRVEEAMIAYKKVLEIAPNRQEVWGLLIRQLVKMNLKDQAEKEIQLFTEKYEDSDDKIGILFYFEMLIGRTGENNTVLQQFANLDDEIEREDALEIVLYDIAFVEQPKVILLELFKNKNFQTFLKKCKKNTCLNALKNVTKALMGDHRIAAAQLHDFHAALTEVFGQKTSMRYPLKFLHLGIRHVKENDPKALLELTLEERRVFEREVLGKVEKV